MHNNDIIKGSTFLAWFTTVFFLWLLAAFLIDRKIKKENEEQ
jgi:hypothetical protein